jgi:hypothetical protein
LRAGGGLQLASRIFNVVGDGVLSQTIRRLGRIQVPIPEPAVDAVGRLLHSCTH